MIIRHWRPKRGLIRGLIRGNKYKNEDCLNKLEEIGRQIKTLLTLKLHFSPTVIL